MGPDRSLNVLVVVDWLLPEMNGVDFLRKIRLAHRGDLAVVLVVTGRDNLGSLEEVLLAGANDYITKPVEVGLLNIRLAVAETEEGAVEQRKQAEDALAAKTRELQTLFQNLDEVFFSLDVPNSHLIQISPAALRVFGVGIGLAIVRRGMERMGGQAGLESTLGEGSRFWPEVPLMVRESTRRNRKRPPR